LGLKEEDFIVFNGNRNQFRKRIDITISAFAEFAKERPNAKLYLHMGTKDQGWDVMQVFGREMVRRGLDPNGRIIMTAQTPNPLLLRLSCLTRFITLLTLVSIRVKGRAGGWSTLSTLPAGWLRWYQTIRPVKRFLRATGS
jgi:hypothetical protein